MAAREGRRLIKCAAAVIAAAGSCVAGQPASGRPSSVVRGAAPAITHDVDGDGVEDILVGAPTAVLGAQGSVTAFSGLTKSALWTTNSAELGDMFGVAIAVIGDVNGDGRDDVAVGAPFSNIGGPSSGRVDILSGADGRVLMSIRDWPSSQLGRSVAAGGDFNGDGTLDVLAGGYLSFAGQAARPCIRVYSGANGALLSILVGEEHDDGFGFSATTLGDLNGDGFADVAVSAPGAANGEGAFGRILVFNGKGSDVFIQTVRDAAHVLSNDDPAIAFHGRSLLRGVDLDKDGKSELVAVSTMIDGQFQIDSIALGNPNPLQSVTVTTLQKSGDADKDLIVNSGDLGVVLNEWGQGGQRGSTSLIDADLTADGQVNMSDLALVLAEYGSASPLSVLAASPGAAASAAMGLEFPCGPLTITGDPSECCWEWQEYYPGLEILREEAGCGGGGTDDGDDDNGDDDDDDDNDDAEGACDNAIDGPNEIPRNGTAQYQLLNDNGVPVATVLWAITDFAAPVTLTSPPAGQLGAVATVSAGPWFTPFTLLAQVVVDGQIICTRQKMIQVACEVEIDGPNAVAVDQSITLSAWSNTQEPNYNWFILSGSECVRLTASGNSATVTGVAGGKATIGLMPNQAVPPSPASCIAYHTVVVPAPPPPLCEVAILNAPNPPVIFLPHTTLRETITLSASSSFPGGTYQWLVSGDPAAVEVAPDGAQVTITFRAPTVVNVVAKYTNGETVCFSPAKTLTAARFWVASVEFGPDDVPIVDDFGGAIVPPHFVVLEPGGAGPPGMKPVVWVRNTPIKVKTVVIRSEPPVSFPVNLLGFQLTTIGGMQGTGAFVNGALTITDLVGSPLPNHVGFYDVYGIRWFLSGFGDGRIFAMDWSLNRMYTTLGPYDPAHVASPRESFYYISAKAAHGATSEPGLVSGVWAKFATRSVENASGIVMGYYRNILCPDDCTVYTAEGLVEIGNSQCFGWADLFRKATVVQGIAPADSAIIDITVNQMAMPASCPLGYQAFGFLVKEYDFTQAGSSSCPGFPFRFNDPCSHKPDNDAVDWDPPVAQDQDGVPGQGHSNPASYFGAHFIVLYDAKYYDPSYGAGPFTGHSQWEAQAIAGYVGLATLLGGQEYRAGARLDTPGVTETSFQIRGN